MEFKQRSDNAEGYSKWFFLHVPYVNEFEQTAPQACYVCIIWSGTILIWLTGCEGSEWDYFTARKKAMGSR